MHPILKNQNEKESKIEVKVHLDESSPLDQMLNSLEKKGILKKSSDEGNITLKDNDCITIKSDRKKKCINFETEYHSPKSPKTPKTKREFTEEPESASPFNIAKPKSKLLSLISKLYLTKKFMGKLRNATVFRKPKWLKAFHFKVINDWSNFQEGINKKPSSFDKKTLKTGPIILFIEILLIFLKTWFKNNTIIDKATQVIHPDRILHIIFDMLMLIVTMISFFVIFLDVGFEMDVIRYYTFHDYILKKGILTLFILDIVSNFNTAYYEKGELICSRSKIFDKYLKGNFLKDIMSLSYFIFWDYYVYPYQDPFFPKFTCLLFLLRLRNFAVIFARLEDFLFLDESNYNYLLFIKLILKVLFIAHFFACFWHFLGWQNISNGANWLHYTGVINDEWWQRYLKSFYYVTVVMNTVGFGDITPQNIPEISFTIFFIYIACGMFAYTINSVGIILQNINKNEREFKRHMNLINGYMRQKNIHFDLRTKIRNYLEYIWKEEKVEDHDAALEVINKLSKCLKEELLLNANGIILRNFPLFQHNFSDNTLRKLIYEMKEINMTPGDIIYHQNDVLDPSIFIIRKGIVELFVPTPRRNETNTVLQILKKGELFGEISFFTELPRETTARCATFASFYAIKRQRFIEILKENSEDYEIFCQIKDNVTLYNEYDNLFIICRSCKESTHPTIYCPFLHLTLSNQRILSKFNFFRPQERSHFTRRNHRTKGARLKFSENRMASKMLTNEANSSENHTLISSNKIESSLDVNQMSSKNSLFGTPRKSIEKALLKTLEKNLVGSDKALGLPNESREYIKEDKIKGKMKKKRSYSTSLITKERPNSQIDLNSEEGTGIRRNFKINTENSSNVLKNIKEKKEESRAELSDSGSSQSSKKSLEKQKSNGEIANNTTTLNNFQTDFEKNNLFDDMCKQYIHYFPHNNVEDVTEKVNMLILRNIKKKRLSRFRSIRKSWMDINPNKTLKSEECAIILI